MGDGESLENEPAGGRETAGEAGERARRLRAQAELAWTRVQEVIQRRPRPSLDLESLRASAERIPTASYLAGIFSALMISSWFYATGRRAIGLALGVSASLLISAGIYVKSTRPSRRV